MGIFHLLEKDFEFADERGSLVQLVHDGYKQINVLTTRAGVFRGGHYHKKSTEAFFVVSGLVEVNLRRDDEIVIKQFSDGDFFDISPFVVHSMKFHKDTIMVVMYDIPIENGFEKDIITI